MKKKLPFFLAIVALAVCIVLALESLFWSCRYIISAIKGMSEPAYSLQPLNVLELILYLFKAILFLSASVLLSLHLYSSTRKDQHERELETELKKQKRIQELQDELNKLKDGE